MNLDSIATLKDELKNMIVETSKRITDHINTKLELTVDAAVMKATSYCNTKATVIVRAYYVDTLQLVPFVLKILSFMAIN